MGLISPIKTFVDKAILTAADLNTEYLNLYDNIVAGTTATVGSVQLEDSHTSTSVTLAACPKNVKEAYDLAATHKNNHDPEDGSDALDTAAPAELASVQAAGVGSAHTFARADHAHQIQHSIANNHIVTVDTASAGNLDYARFTASGLMGRNYAEVRSDLNIEDGADVTDATNVEAAGAVIENDYTAHSILQATTTQTPVVLTVGEQTVVGRITAGNIVALTPAQLRTLINDTRCVVIKCIADATALSTGNGIAHFTVPIEFNGMNLVSVGAHVYTVSSSGLPNFMIHNLTDASDMLSTAITIDATESDSSTALTPAVINAAEDDVVTGDIIRLDCDAAGTGTKGMEIRLGFRTTV